MESNAVGVGATIGIGVPQGGASNRGARACLPWASVFNAVGVCMTNVDRAPQGGASTRGARACLPWAMVLNAVGVWMTNANCVSLSGAGHSLGSCLNSLGYGAVGVIATIGIDVSQGVTALRATPATDRVSVA